MHVTKTQKPKQMTSFQKRLAVKLVQLVECRSATELKRHWTIEADQLASWTEYTPWLETWYPMENIKDIYETVEAATTTPPTFGFI